MDWKRLEGKNFANLRQIYNSMILAVWYKKNLEKSLLGQMYVNQRKVSGIDVADKEIHQKIYSRYLEAFEKGVFNFIKEDYDSLSQEMMPRKYFSGGIDPKSIGNRLEEGSDDPLLSGLSQRSFRKVTANSLPVGAGKEKLMLAFQSSSPINEATLVNELAQQALLSERIKLLMKISGDGEIRHKKVILKTSQNREREVQIPWSNNAGIQQLVIEHLTMLSFNFILYGKNNFLIVQIEDDQALESQVAESVGAHLNDQYLTALQQNITSENMQTRGYFPVYPQTDSPPYAEDTEQYLLESPSSLPRGEYVTVDIGGNSMKIVVYQDGAIMEERVFSHKASLGYGEFIASIEENMRSFLSDSKIDPEEIEMLLPGIIQNNVSRGLGFIEWGWSEADIRKSKDLHMQLTRAWDGNIKFTVTNDVIAAAQAVAVEESVREANVLSWGTGVGTAVIRDGKVLNEPTQLGVMRIRKQPGEIEHIQKFAGVPFIQQTASELGFEQEFTDVSLRLLQDSALSAWNKQEGERLTNDEEIAVRILEDTISMFAEFMIEGTNVTRNQFWYLVGGNFQGAFGQRMISQIERVIAQRAPHLNIELRQPTSNPQFLSGRGGTYIAALRRAAAHSESANVETWYPLVSYERYLKEQKGKQVQHKIRRLDQKVEGLAGTRLEDKGNADIVVIVPTYKRTDNIPNVVRNIAEGLKAHYSDRQAVILLTGEEERRSDFQEMFDYVKQSGIEDNNIEILGIVKDEINKGKGWSLRAGLKLGKLLFPLGVQPPGMVLVIDDDIRNIGPEWMPKFFRPLEGSQHLTVSSYSARRYANDDRSLKDHFVSPFFSAWTGQRLIEAEGEYGVRQGPLLDALLDDEHIWSYDFPEFFYIPKAVELGLPMAGINIPVKDHDHEPNPFDRFSKYAQTFFDFTLTQPWLVDGEQLNEVVQHDLTGLATEDFINIDPQEFLRNFQREYNENFNRIYRQILPGDTYAVISRLSSGASFEETVLTDEQWAGIVFLFLKRYRRLSPRERPFILPALTPLLKLRIASFVHEVQSQELPYDQVHQRLKDQTDLFVREREKFLEEEYRNAAIKFVIADEEGKKQQAINQLGLVANRKDIVTVRLNVVHVDGSTGRETVSVPQRLLEDHYAEFVEYLSSLLVSQAELKGFGSVGLEIASSPVTSQETLLWDIREHFTRHYPLALRHANFNQPIMWGTGEVQKSDVQDLRFAIPEKLNEEIGFGIDISGNLIRIGVYNGKELIYKREIHTSEVQTNLGNTLREQLYKMADEFHIDRKRFREMRFVAGVPGLVHPDGSIIDLPQLEKDHPQSKESLQQLQDEFSGLQFRNATDIAAIFVGQQLNRQADNRVLVLNTFRTGLGFSLLQGNSVPPAPLEAHLKYQYRQDPSTEKLYDLQGDLYNLTAPIGILTHIQTEIENDQGLARLIDIKSLVIKTIMEAKTSDIPEIMKLLIELLSFPDLKVRDYVEQQFVEMGRGMGSLYTQVAQVYNLEVLDVIRTGWVNNEQVAKLIKKGISDYMSSYAPHVTVNDLSDQIKMEAVKDDLWGTVGSALLSDRVAFPSQNPPRQNGEEHKAVITGVAGVLGQQLAAVMLNAGHQTTGLVRPINLESTKLPMSDKFSVLVGDLLSNASLVSLVEDHDTVYLAGAMTEVEKISRQAAYEIAEVLAVNGFIPHRIVQLRNSMGRTKQARVIFISSQVVYWVGDEPIIENIDENLSQALTESLKKWIDGAIREYRDVDNQEFFNSEDNLGNTLVKWLEAYIQREGFPEEVYPYKLAKLIAERLLLDDTRSDENSNVVIVRPTSIFDSNDVSVNHLLPRVLRPIVRGQSGVYRSITTDYVYNGDVAEALMRIADVPSIRRGKNNIINMASSYNYTADDVYAVISDHLSIEESRLFTLSRPDKVMEPPRFNNSRFKELLGREPIRLEQVIGDHIQKIRKAEGASSPIKELDQSVFAFAEGEEGGLQRFGLPIADEDSSMSNKLGGIDFNPNNLNIETKGSIFDTGAPIDFQKIRNMSIDGFSPVIINVSPIINLQFLLGKDKNQYEEQLSKVSLK